MAPEREDGTGPHRSWHHRRPRRIQTGACEPLANSPYTQIVNRATLLRELETRTAELVESLRDLDDLVLLFNGTALGRRFIAVWENARLIVDANHGSTEPAPPPPPAPRVNRTATTGVTHGFLMAETGCHTPTRRVSEGVVTVRPR